MKIEGTFVDDDSLVVAEGVGRVFHGRRRDIEALRDVDLRVGRGEFVSLLGPSGCGKSTLLRIIGGLVPYDSGRVLVHGTSPATARAAKMFGLVPQSPALMPWKTVTDNVRFLSALHRGRSQYPPLSSTEVDELLDAVGLSAFVNAYPHELSGGMQQRVSLVRGFALGAPILLMDEPFAALDEITRSDMRYLLLQLWNRTKATVLFVTHSVTEAAILSDRVMVMAPRPGRIAAARTVELPRPRTVELEDDPRFFEVVRQLRADLREFHAPPIEPR